MQIPVLIEPTGEHRYRATGSAPFAASAEAETPEAALAKVRQLIEERISRGARIATVELPDGQNPWLEGAGMFRDDPLFDAWQKAMMDYRRRADERADTP
jgi:hypothetical protein